MTYQIWNNSDQKKYISIVTPTCGRCDLFIETLESISAQTSKDFELIITDDTADVTERNKIFEAVEKFAHENPLITTTYIFTKSGQYQSRNVNQGLRLATGKFIHILHSDDLLHPETIAYEISCLEKYPRCSCLYYRESLFYDKPNLRYNEGFSIVCPKNFLNIDYLLGHPLPSATVFNRDLLFKTALMDPRFKFICDLDLFWSFAKEAIKEKSFFIFSKAEFIGWRRHSFSVSTSDIQFHREHLKLMKKIFFSEFNKKNPLIEKPELINYIIRAYHNRIFRIFDFFSADNKHLYLSHLPELMRIHIKEHRFYKKIKNLSKKFKFPQNKKNKIYTKIKKQYDISYTNIKHEDIPQDTILNITNHKESDFKYTINCVFDNEFNLQDKKHIISEYNTIILSNFYFNRYAKRTLNETLKYINKDQHFIISISDNMFFTARNILELIEKKHQNRFKLVSHKSYTTEKHVLEYKCINNIELQNEGFTFVLELKEHNPKYIEAFIKKIKLQNFDSYEILIFSENAKPELETIYGNGKIKILTKDKLGCSLMKFISENANFDNILFTKEGILPSDSLKTDMQAHGLIYEIMLPHVINQEQERVNDYYYIKNNFKHPLSYTDYSDYSIVEPNAYFIKKQTLKSLDYALENDEQNIEFSREAHKKDCIIEIINTNFIDTTNNLESLPFIPYKNPLYEQLYDKIAINGKIYK